MLQSALSRFDGAIASETAGSADLRTLMFVGLMALTLRQAWRGEIMAPALPLLGMALSLADRITAPEGKFAESVRATDPPPQ